MPIVMRKGKSVVVCVNETHPSHCNKGENGTMMEDQNSFLVLTGIVPPSKGRFAYVPSGPNKCVPVEAISCDICGYTELYSATITQPDIWPQIKFGERGEQEGP